MLRAFEVILAPKPMAVQRDVFPDWVLGFAVGVLFTSVVLLVLLWLADRLTAGGHDTGCACGADSCENRLW